MGISMESVTNYFRDLSRIPGNWADISASIRQAKDIHSIHHILDQALESLIQNQQSSLKQVDEMVDYLIEQKDRSKYSSLPFVSKPADIR